MTRRDLRVYREADDLTAPQEEPGQRATRLKGKIYSKNTDSHQPIRLAPHSAGLCLQDAKMRPVLRKVMLVVFILFPLNTGQALVQEGCFPRRMSGKA